MATPLPTSFAEKISEIASEQLSAQRPNRVYDPAEALNNKKECAPLAINGFPTPTHASDQTPTSPTPP